MAAACLSDPRRLERKKKSKTSCFLVAERRLKWLVVRSVAVITHESVTSRSHDLRQAFVQATRKKQRIAMLSNRSMYSDTRVRSIPPDRPLTTDNAPESLEKTSVLHLDERDGVSDAAGYEILGIALKLQRDDIAPCSSPGYGPVGSLWHRWSMVAGVTTILARSCVV